MISEYATDFGTVARLAVRIQPARHCDAQQQPLWRRGVTETIRRSLSGGPIYIGSFKPERRRHGRVIHLRAASR